MAICKHCGAELEGNVKVCPECGTPVEGSTKNEKEKEENIKAQVKETTNNTNNSDDTLPEFDEEDIRKNKAMAILSYVWILVIIPLLSAPKSKFARFHANQGLVLLIANILYGIIRAILVTIIAVISYNASSIIGSILNIGYVVFTILQILGVVNAATGKAKELPLIGKIKLLK